MLLAAKSARFTPQDVFESAAMNKLIEELRMSFDLVVLDCAPVLAIAETRTLAGLADLALLVVRCDRTPAAASATAIKHLKQSNANIAGVALNYVDPRRPGRGSYGDSLYYRYARGYYHE